MTPHEALAVAMRNQAFRAGYKAAKKWGWRPPWEAPPLNPYAAGTTDADAWALGVEQAELEDGSPDSWHYGGAGKRGVLRSL